MRILIQTIILSLAIGRHALLAQPNDTLATRKLHPEGMKSDFTMLRRVLTETHPALYRYSTQEIMKAKMDSIEALLDQPMPFYDFHLLLAGLISDVRCAHTHLTPVKDIESYYLDRIRTFPLMIFQVNNKFYVTVNGSPNPAIRPGYEVLEINHQPIQHVHDKMLRYLWSDGYNKTLKLKTISEAYFPMFYYLLIERPDSFLVKTRDPEGKEMEVQLTAQRYRETRSWFTKNPINKEIMAMASARNKLDQKKGWRVTLRKEDHVAVMRIKSFGGGRTEEEARAKMHTFLEKRMKNLNNQKVKDLIIDLRYNPGGWDIQAVELFTYLIEEPSRCYRRLYSITDSTEFFKFSDLSAYDLQKVKSELKKEPDGTFSVIEEKSNQLKMQPPQPNRFKGTVYVLANGGTASAASEFVAAAKSHHRIILIGDETGGAYEGGNGGSFLNFILPHSRISIGTPLLSYDNEVTPPLLKGRGTMPDHAVPHTIEDLMKGRDVQLEFTLDLIKQGRRYPNETK